MSAPTTHTLTLASTSDTETLARRLAGLAVVGDVILLSGEIGAGKSVFARAFIRARLGNATEDVPSPTFTIVQTYPHDDGEIWHLDLYRLSTADEAIELGLDDAFETAICLIEWPAKLGDAVPMGALDIHLRAGTDHHAMRITAPAAWAARLGILA